MAISMNSMTCFFFLFWDGIIRQLRFNHWYYCTKRKNKQYFARGAFTHTHTHTHPRLGLVFHDQRRCPRWWPSSRPPSFWSTRWWRERASCTEVCLSLSRKAGPRGSHCKPAGKTNVANLCQIKFPVLLSHRTIVFWTISLAVGYPAEWRQTDYSKPG